MPADTRASGTGLVMSEAFPIHSPGSSPAQKSDRCRRKLFLICGLSFLLGAAVNITYHWGTLTHPNLLAPPDDLNNWQMYVGGAARATLRREGGELRLDVSAVDGTARHVQLFQRGVDLREGHAYTLRFRARANTLRDVWVEAHLDQPDYHNIGLERIAPLVPQWQAFTDTFQATRVLASDTSVPCFVVGSKAGTVWLTDLSLTEASPAEGARAGVSPSPPHPVGRLKGTKEIHGDL